jgi:predicted DNA-binding transcriptional regulator AlpA
LTLWDTKETAERIGWSERSLERARVTGDGPPFIRVGSRRVMYSSDAVTAWLATRTYPHRAAELAGKAVA